MFLFEIVLEIAQMLRQFYEDNLSAGGPARRMERQLRIMYGRGEIDRNTFFKLRSNLEKGYYIEGELQYYHRQGLARLQVEGRNFDYYYDAHINRSLENVYQNRAMLEEARREMTQALKIMEANRAWIQQQADSAQASARLALPDEAGARAYLEIRQDLLERLQVLDRRAAEVQQNLRQIDMLQAELGVAEAELMLVDSQEHYAGVRLALHD